MKAAGMAEVEATSAEGMRLQRAASAVGAASQGDTSIHALIGNSVGSGAAPYLATAAFSLAMTSATALVMVTRATTLLGIARNTPTATTPLSAATIRMPARRIDGGLS